MDANIPVCFAVKTSSEWTASGLTLLKGQIALETGEDGKVLYILIGDGNPVNVNPAGVSTDPAYTRLRDTYATDLLQKNLDKKAEELQGKISLEREERGQAVAGEAEARAGAIAAAVAAEAEARDAAILSAVTVALADGDADGTLPAAVPGPVAAILQTVRNNLKWLFEKVRSVLEGLETHENKTDEAHGIPGQIDGKIAVHNADGTAHGIPGRIAAHNAEEEAHPGIRAGVSELGKDFEWMYGLTAETSGRLLRECGHAGPSLPFRYLRTVDAEAGTDPVYREADSSRYSHADYVTKRDWERMLVLVMATAGETLRAADGGYFVERAVDGERGTAELRAADFMRGGGGSGGVFEEAVWV